MATDNVYQKDLNLAHTSTSDSLQQEFIALHMYGSQRADYDKNSCQQAIGSDSDSIKTLTNPHSTNKQLIDATMADLGTDIQAMGDKTHQGDDAKNAALDQQIISVDRRYLAAHPELDEALRKAINHDIDVRNKDLQFSEKDRTQDEPKYVADDRAFLAALKSGNQSDIDRTRQVLLVDRHADQANERTYVRNNRDAVSTENQIVKALVSTNVLNQFGHLHIDS